MRNKILLYDIINNSIIGYTIDDFSTLSEQKYIHWSSGGGVGSYYVDSNLTIIISNQTFYIICLCDANNGSYRAMLESDSMRYGYRGLDDFEDKIIRSRSLVPHYVNDIFKSGKCDKIKSLLREFKLTGILD